MKGIENIKKNTTLCSGMYSVCKDGKHCVFVDYDTKNLTRIEYELRYLQSKFMLGDFFLLETTKGVHAVCCSKVTLAKYIEVLGFTACDPEYVETLKRTERTVLRFSPKGNKPQPKYIGCIRSKFGTLQESNAHLRFLKNYYKAGVRFKNADRNKELKICQYRTRK